MVVLEIKDYGTIKIELDEKNAPISSENFKNLVEEGFYDGIIFHRVIENFMIQGGDPNGTGTGGSSKNIPGEFSSNGFENNLKHVRGVLSMARTNDPNSASSQFFVMHQNAPHLDGQYAAFGCLTDGFEVLDKIAASDTGRYGYYSDVPKTAVIIEDITIED
jgi:peptidyl-prolyl cis-trans isomerase B (cyclophilin B)